MSTAQQVAPEVLENARDNASSFPVVTIAYLKQRGIPADEWVRFMGERYAASWDDVKGDTKAVADYVKLNIENCGGEVRELRTDPGEISIVAAWPVGAAADFAAQLGLTGQDTRPLLHIFDPIADHLDLQLSLEHEGDAVRMHFQAT